MKRFGFTISKYILKSILPYFLFSWILLSVILFLQQGSRFSDVFLSNTLPQNIVWQLAIALIPSVLSFTSPIAILIGGIIGLSKLQSDRELTVMRAAGIGNFQIAVPLIIIGILFSVFAFYINIYGVPFGARIIRQVALQAAVLKLESPIEPGVFNTEIRGFTVFVKSGDYESGKWEQIFIHYLDEQTGDVRLITSKNGRIDVDDFKKTAEIFLENATITTINPDNEKFIAEKIRDFRFSISTKRNELIEKIKNSEKTTEELSLNELAEYARSKTGDEKLDAVILWQRKIILSITPLIFAFLSTGLMVKFRQGNRGMGILLALICLIFYYLTTLLGEQLARTKIINTYWAGLIPIVLSSAAILYLFLSQKIAASRKFEKISQLKELKDFTQRIFGSRSHSFLSSNIFDLDIIFNLLKFYLLSIGIFGSIFIIFTAFELWKFAGTIENGFALLFAYLIYLIPYIYLQITSSALMLATLATYIIKSRRREIVIWTSAGRSIYRLLFPCLLFMIIFGVINFAIQETILPSANIRQDNLRVFIRSRGKLSEKKGKLWAVKDNKIYSFNMDSAKNNMNVINFTVYQFDENAERLQSIISAEQAKWESNAIKFPKGAKKSLVQDGSIITSVIEGEITENYNPFNTKNDNPGHLSTMQLREQIQNNNSESENSNYLIALQKRYSTLVIPLVIVLFTAPFAVAVSRQGNILTIAFAIGLWLVFTGIISVFEQMAENYLIMPELAVWSPLCFFAILGIILISRKKT